MSDCSNKEIVERLDLLIALQKLAFKDEIANLKKTINDDAVSRNILNYLDEEPLDYSTLSEKVSEKTGKSERTVKSRISDLTEKNVLKKSRREGKTFYSISGVID
ncbi:MAG: hypothetical protein ACTSW1_06530 [Candidatus Hodarchaeales archaeon]